MKVLVACEESQVVTKEFRALGHEAYSCDLQPCSGGHPEWHLQQDVIPLLDKEWDLLIAHPPCIYLTVTGNRWFDIEKFGEKAKERHKNRKEAIDFFMKFANAKCERIAIENPVCVMSSQWRKPDQIIEPFYFGDRAKKRTCLWLKNLPKLVPTNIVDKGEMIECKRGLMAKWYYDALKLKPKDRSKIRSRTFSGIAKGMASQWGNLDKYIETNNRGSLIIL